MTRIEVLKKTGNSIRLIAIVCTVALAGLFVWKTIAWSRGWVLTRSGNGDKTVVVKKIPARGMVHSWIETLINGDAVAYSYQVSMGYNDVAVPLTLYTCVTPSSDADFNLAFVKWKGKDYFVVTFDKGSSLTIYCRSQVTTNRDPVPFQTIWSQRPVPEALLFESDM